MDNFVATTRPAISFHLSVRYWKVIGIVALYIFSGTSFYQAYQMVRNQFNQTTYQTGTGLYYKFEYYGLVDKVETGHSLDFFNSRAWRRGPMAYLWMLPLAKTYGKSLNTRWILSLDLAIIAVCIWLSIVIFGTGIPYAVSIPVFSLLWINNTATVYRIGLGDVNSLLGFCLFPMTSYWMLTRDRIRYAGVSMALAAHFRVLPISGVIYFLLKTFKSWIPMLITLGIILTLGHFLVSPYQGYLYWFTMARDLLFTGKDTQTAAIGWHESISLQSAFAKLLAGFHFNNYYTISLAPSLYRVGIWLGAISQLLFFTLFIRMLGQNRRWMARVTWIGEQGKKLAREGLLIEIAMASLLTYVLAPEYGNDFLVTLMPVFCVGAYFMFNHFRWLNPSERIAYLLALVLTPNVFGFTWICGLFHFDAIHRWQQCPIEFICYESLNVFLVPLVGVAFGVYFLLSVRARLMNSLI